MLEGLGFRGLGFRVLGFRVVLPTPFESASVSKTSVGGKVVPARFAWASSQQSLVSSRGAFFSFASRAPPDRCYRSRLCWLNTHTTRTGKKRNRPVLKPSLRVTVTLKDFGQRPIDGASILVDRTRSKQLFHTSQNRPSFCAFYWVTTFSSAKRVSGWPKGQNFGGVTGELRRLGLIRTQEWTALLWYCKPTANKKNHTNCKSGNGIGTQSSNLGKPQISFSSEGEGRPQILKATWSSTNRQPRYREDPQLMNPKPWTLSPAPIHTPWPCPWPLTPEL